jgi:hypothetical protein
MAPMRSVSLRLSSFLVRSLLCFAVVMQMLGTPTSLWTLDLNTDLIQSSLLEGLSVPPDQVTLSPVIVTSVYVESPATTFFVLLAKTFFRPPYEILSPLFLA